MTAAPNTAAPIQRPATRDPDDARLLEIVRQLLAQARDLVTMLKARNATTPPMEVARRFCCVNLALIITRITRGLLIAQALEARLIRRSRMHPDTMMMEHARQAARTPRTDATPRRPRRTDAQDDAELGGELPSAREIARRLRGRPIGAVIVEICRDLGIDTQHPLWREISKAILFRDGSMVRMLAHWTRNLAGLEQVAELAAATVPPIPPPTPPP